MYLLIKCRLRENREYVFDNIEKMVIKRTNQSGGYGMLMGNKATEEEIINTKDRY